MAEVPAKENGRLLVEEPPVLNRVPGRYSPAGVIRFRLP